MINETTFLEDLEDDFYGLWEVPEFFDGSEVNDFTLMMDNVLRLVQDKGVRIFEGSAGTRSDMVEVIGDDISKVIYDKDRWSLPAGEDDRGVFVVRKPNL